MFANHVKKATPAFLRSLCALVVFVSFGAGQALFTTASRDPGGKLPYSKASASLLVDASKLVVALTCILCFERCDVRRAPWPPPRRWCGEFLELGVLATLFTVQNGLGFWVVESLGAGLFVLLSNMKIAWTVFFMSVFAKKRFAATQWAGVVLLIASSVLLAGNQIWTRRSHPANPNLEMQAAPPSVGLLCITMSTCSSGFSSVVNEVLLKRGTTERPSSDARVGKAAESLPFWVKNAVLYFFGFVLNLGGWFWSRGGAGLLDGFNAAAFGAICSMVGMGFSVAFILRYLDSVIRCFGTVMLAFVTLLASPKLPGAESEAAPGPAHALALALVAMGLVLYAAHESPAVLRFAALAAACALLLGAAIFDGRVEAEL